MEEEYYIGQIFEGSYPQGAADFCNETQTAIITEIEPLEDGTIRYQIIAIEPHQETLLEKLIRLEGEYQMNRWQREAILAEGSPYTDFTKARARELEDLAEQIRKESENE